MESDKPQWRSAQNGRKLTRHNIDSAALNKAMLADEGHICKTGACKTSPLSGLAEMLSGWGLVLNLQSLHI